MVTPQDIAAELSSRIQADLEHFGGAMPERSAIAWRGYLAAMLEWSLISVSQHDELLLSIPSVHNDPVIAILRGRD